MGSVNTSLSFLTNSTEKSNSTMILYTFLKIHGMLNERGKAYKRIEESFLQRILSAKEMTINSRVALPVIQCFISWVLKYSRNQQQNNLGKDLRMAIVCIYRLTV